MTYIAVLFLHGLGFAAQADNVNKIFTGALNSSLKDLQDAGTLAKDVDISIATVNYARLFSTRQGRLWKNQQFSWFNLVSLLRMVPLNLLNMGLAFWGDDKVKKEVLGHLVAAIHGVASTIKYKQSLKGKTDEKVVLVFVGFSMGATLAIELLTEFETIFQHDTSGIEKACVELSDDAKWLLKKFSLLITLGCAVSWHHPVRPFHRKVDIPWYNIHYCSDVLATGMRHQGEEVEHVIEKELGYVPQFRTIKCNQSWISMYTRTLYKFLLFLGRLTPLSHFCYFYDEDIYDLLSKEISNTLDELYHVQFSLEYNGKPRKSISDINPAVSLNPIPLKISDTKTQDRKQTVVIYVHGMSTPGIVDSEIQSVIRGLEFASKKIGLSNVKLYLLSYYHQMAKDLDIVGETSGGQSLWSRIRSIVNSRAPIALSYWSESLVRARVHNDFEVALRNLAKSLDQTDVDTQVVIIGYTIGSIVASLSLGEIQQKYKVGSASEILSSLCSKLNIKLSHFISIASPLPWFSPSETLPLPSWTSSPGWTNIYYEKDFNAISLKRSGDLLNKVVSSEILLERGSFFRKKIDVIFPLSIVVWIIDMILTWAGIYEFLGSFNGAYLNDKQVWIDIATIIKNV